MHIAPGAANEAAELLRQVQLRQDHNDQSTLGKDKAKGKGKARADPDDDDDDEEMADVPAMTTPAAATQTSLPTRSRTQPLPAEEEDFTIPQWQTMALGWRDFQTDLRHAAKMGVRVWRMKVGVVIVPVAREASPDTPASASVSTSGIWVP